MRPCSAPRSSTRFSAACSASSCFIRATSIRSSTSRTIAIPRIWEKDGELARDRYTLASYLLWVLGPTYWYTRVRRIVRFSLGIVTEPYIPEDRKADVIREARWHLAGYAAIAALSIATGSWIAVKLWLLPMLVMKPVHQLQNTIEHLGLPHVDAITENTRSTRTNALMRWMCWNMQYHTAHHAFPGVPCYALPRLHQEIFVARGRLPHTMSYLAFQWAVLRAFWNGRTEADYPDDAIWIADDTDLQPVAPRVPARQAGVTPMALQRLSIAMGDRDAPPRRSRAAGRGAFRPGARRPASTAWRSISARWTSTPRASSSRNSAARV